MVEEEVEEEREKEEEEEEEENGYKEEEEEEDENGYKSGYNQKRGTINPKGISRAQFSIDMRDFSDNSYDDDEWSDWDSDCKPEETQCQPNSL